AGRHAQRQRVAAAHRAEAKEIGVDPREVRGRNVAEIRRLWPVVVALVVETVEVDDRRLPASGFEYSREAEHAQRRVLAYRARGLGLGDVRTVQLTGGGRADQAHVHSARGSSSSSPMV